MTLDESVIGIMREIKENKVAWRDRRQGKTTALLSLIYYAHDGKAVVVAGFGWAQAELLLCRWRELFPGSLNSPIFTIYGRDLGRGTDLPIYVDEYSHLDIDQQDDLSRNPNFKGGVTS